MQSQPILFCPAVVIFNTLIIYKSIAFELNMKTSNKITFVDPCKTPQPLGIENGEIPDSSMTASSFYDNDHKSFYARLRKQSTKCSWAPTQKSNSWMQVDLGQQAIVTRIATQGSCYSDWNEYAKSFIIQYSNDSNKWTNYKELGEVKVRHLLSKHFQCHNIQIYNKIISLWKLNIYISSLILDTHY